MKGVLIRVGLWVLVFVEWIGKKLRILSLLLVLSGCAKTDFFYDGQKVASFQGDMRNSRFTMTITAQSVVIAWNADAVDHSTPTRAQGDLITAGAGVISAGVAAAVLLPK